MVYRKPWTKIHPSRRTVLDFNSKALIMVHQDRFNCWIPVGMRSKKRFQNLLNCSEDLLSELMISNRLTNDIYDMCLANPPFRSIPEEYWVSFLKLAKRRRYSIYVEWVNLTPTIHNSQLRGRYTHLLNRGEITPELVREDFSFEPEEIDAK